MTSDELGSRRPATPGPALGDRAADCLERYLVELERTRVSVSSVTDRRRARDVHLADSLAALSAEPSAALLTGASRVADIGSGGGFPGVALAAALPQAEFDLIESVGRKCEFMREALAAAGIANARPVNARAEEWAASEGREAYDVVTARAVGRLAELAELASPLLKDGGFLIAWKGRRDADEEAELEAAADATAMTTVSVRPVTPFPESRNRHLHLIRKSGPTPEALPRRPGMARKRPLGS